MFPSQAQSLDGGLGEQDAQPSLRPDSQDVHADVPAEGGAAHVVCLALLVMCTGALAHLYFGSLLTFIDF